jgi:MFS family permease
VVIACHFVASFAALGLPPFFPDLLPGLGDPQARWAGVLYVVPTACVAISAPLWGRLADRYGRKRLLLRAQLGLAVSFWLASQAQSVAQFAAVLVLQGLLGGTFSASHAYLASALRGPRLAGALTAMQFSARAALVVAPVTVALLAVRVGPQELYAWLAALPLLAALLVARLPEPAATAEQSASAAELGAPAARQAAPVAGLAASAAMQEASAAGLGTPAAGTRPQTSAAAPLPAVPLYALEATFVFATVVSFPYFLVLLREVVPSPGNGAAGILFALPHLFFLVAAGPTLAMLRTRVRTGLMVGFVGVALGLVLHALPAGAPGLVLGRLLFGAGLTAGLVALSVRTAEVARDRSPGALFGTLEMFSKTGAVIAGAVASLLAPRLGPAAPCLLGALIATGAAVVLFTRGRSARARIDPPLTSSYSQGFDILPALKDQDSNRSPEGSMLRFALHRQGQNSQVSTRCHGMSLRGLTLVQPSSVGLGYRPTGLNVRPSTDRRKRFLPAMNGRVSTIGVG